MLKRLLETEKMAHSVFLGKHLVFLWAQKEISASLQANHAWGGVQNRKGKFPRKRHATATSAKAYIPPPTLLFTHLQVNLGAHCGTRRGPERDGDISPTTYRSRCLPPFDTSPYAASGPPQKTWRHNAFFAPCAHADMSIPRRRFVWIGDGGIF